jgi:ankyrin repeat protein/uncharacterized membrane protein YhaH (DUF805 family)
MQALAKAFDAIVQWISIKGRINRTDFWLCYALPAAVLVVTASLLSVPVLHFIAALIIGSGLVKRRNDSNIKISGGKKAGLGLIWIVVAVVAAGAALVAFLGGISGLGNKGMLETAALLALIPILPVLLAPLIIALLPGSRDANEHGPVPRGFSLGKGQLPAVTGLVLLLSVVGLGISGLQPRESQLIQAIKDDRTQQLRRLLRDGTDPNQTTLAGTTALMLALEERGTHTLLAIPLLEHGADPNAISIHEWEAQGSDDRSGSGTGRQLTLYTPLVYAISTYTGDYAWVVREMIEAGANVNPVPAHEGELSPLLTAATESDSELIEFLLAHGADLKDPSNRPALAAAIERRDVRMTWLLLSGENDLDQLDSAIALVNTAMEHDSKSIKLRTLDQFLKEDFNRESGEERYPYRQFFSGEPRQMESLTSYTQQSFSTPLPLLSMHHVPVYKGPDFAYEKVGKLYAGQELFATAITNVGNHIVWFKVKGRESEEGYVFGSALCTYGGWYRGLWDGCQLPDR